MSEAKFTPSPWRVESERNVQGQKYYSVSFGDDDGQICDFIGYKEDANLIAAAPELYHFLKMATEEACSACAMMMVDPASYDFIENGCPFDNQNELCEYRDCIAILRKARGESEAVK